MNDDSRKVLWRVWGEYHQYPQCCIDAFIEGNSADYHEGKVWAGSGFRPCKCCDDTISGMTKQQFISLLGHDPFDYYGYYEMFKVCLDQTKESTWVEIANKYGYDIQQYQNWLKSEMEGT